jgi:LmbE family N-acetylglucosaminyl deacetylase
MPELVDEVPETVLAIYAHPDDPEVSAGGSLALWARAGATVHVCVCADGDKGSLDPEADPQKLARVRREETAAAGRILGVAEHHWLGIPDGEVSAERGLAGRLVQLIRRVKPSLVVAPDPTAVFFGQHYINHPDHRGVGWATLEAVAPASANPHYYRDGGLAHRVGLLYLSGTLEPDAWIDMSETIDAKTAAIACHASQLEDTEEWLRGAVRQRAEEAGRQVSVPFAEAFRRIVLT